MTKLVSGSVRRTLLGMAFPMLAATLAINLYNLTDTYFVSRLGTAALAAMGFTMPVVMLLGFAAGGLGTGVTTLTSHAIGRGDRAGAAKLATHGMLLTAGTSLALSVAGYLSVEAGFARLGADVQTMPLIRSFMGIWYLGGLTMALPAIGNGLLMAAGDSRAASQMMILGTGLNAVLNPILIFGYLGLPPMGIAGSALATVLAQATSTVWLLQLLYRKYGLLTLARWPWRAYLASFRQIVAFAIPSVLSMVLAPLSIAVVTRLLSGFGNEVVAAVGAAGRIEMLAFVIPMALGISLTPFVSQNYGAGRFDRIVEARRLSVRFALAYGGAVAVVFFLAAPWLAAVFSDDPKVVAPLVAYIRIIAFSYGMLEVHRYNGFFLTGLHRPAQATLLNVARVLVLLLPLSFLGAAAWGANGVFAGRLATDLIIGSAGLVWVSRTCARAMAAAAAPAVGRTVAVDLPQAAGAADGGNT
jgi:putative MATE family efflux protein